MTKDQYAAERTLIQARIASETDLEAGHGLMAALIELDRYASRLFDTRPDWSPRKSNGGAMPGPRHARGPRTRWT